MQEGLLALIAATTILILIPGPNAALIVVTSLSHGLSHRQFSQENYRRIPDGGGCGTRAFAAQHLTPRTDPGQR